MKKGLLVIAALAAACYAVGRGAEAARESVARSATLHQAAIEAAIGQ